GPPRVIGEEPAVLLHRRTAAGHVDRDRREPFVRGDGLLGQFEGGRLGSTVEWQGPATAGLARRVDLVPLGRQHPYGRRVHIVEERAWDTPGHERDRAAALHLGVGWRHQR